MPAMGSHLICYCKDCRAFSRHLGKDDFILEAGGTRIFQTRPDWIEIVEGAEHIAAMKLSPRGLTRWYASCCNTPLAATSSRATLPFVSLSADIVTDVETLGPVIAQGFTASAKPPAPGLKDKGLAALFMRFLSRTLGAYFSGAHRANPFFPEGKPLMEPELISKDARKAATD